MKDRLLNILLLTFVFLLAMNYFLPKPAPIEEKTVPNFVVQASSVVIPNIPEIFLKNPTDHTVSFDTCKELEILKDLRRVDIDTDAAKGFCKTLSVASKSSVKLDFSPIHALFESPADIGFKARIDGTELTASIKVEERGFFRILFATVFYAPVLNLFVFLLSFFPGHSLGLAIIAITILVRLLLLYPQHHVLVSARKMQEIQPHVKSLQEKHKGDQATMGKELMELYKREKVNPLGSCLPLLIQMPILIVLYWVLISISDASNHYYLYPVFQNFATSSIDIHFIGLDLLSIGGLEGAGLAILVAVTQWLQIKLSQIQLKPSTAPKPPKDPDSVALDPELMNRMMLWGMPLMIGITTYYFPLGVGIYWFIGTLFMLVQQAVANRFVAKKK